MYGSENNRIRDISGTEAPNGDYPVNERFKVGDDNTLQYRNDIKEVSPNDVGGHLHADRIFDDIG